jgi:hypothetical protein
VTPTPQPATVPKALLPYWQHLQGRVSNLPLFYP